MRGLAVISAIAACALAGCGGNQHARSGHQTSSRGPGAGSGYSRASWTVSTGDSEDGYLNDLRDEQAGATGVGVSCYGPTSQQPGAPGYEEYQMMSAGQILPPGWDPIECGYTPMIQLDGQDVAYIEFAVNPSTGEVDYSLPQ